MMRQIIAGLLVVSLMVFATESRYLPIVSRSTDDSLLRLRQLLRDLLQNDLDNGADHQMVAYEPRMYKREAFERPLQYLH